MTWLEFADKVRTFYYVAKYEWLLGKARFGPCTVVKCKLDISGPGKVLIGSNCIFERDPWGDDYVTIYTHRPEAKVIIGNRVLLRATRFGSHMNITIKDGAVLENASIFDSDFHNIDAHKRDEDFNEGDRPVVIGEDSYVGCECLCSKGTVLQKNVVLLPGGMVGTKIIPEFTLAGGYPAKPIRTVGPTRLHPENVPSNSPQER